MADQDPQPQPGENPNPEPAAIPVVAPAIEPAQPAAAPVIDDAAADEPAPAPAAAENTSLVVGSEKWIENASAQDLRAHMEQLESGRVPVVVVEKPVEAAPAAAVAEPAASAQETPVFTFTDTSDYDTFAAEEAKYREMIEMTPELKTIFDRHDTRIAELVTQIGSASNEFQADESVQKHMGAFDELVTFRKDDESNTFVPNTGGLITLLAKDYTKELPQVVRDLNELPSGRYPGHTLYQEFIRDYAQLDDQGMQRLDYFLHNHGRLQHPDFVPEGVHPSLSEAYWTAENREALQLRIEAAQFTLTKDADATAAEKEKAKADLNSINSELNRAQRGLNADRERAEAIKTQQEKQIQAIQHEAVDRFVLTTRELVKAVGTEAAKGLGMFDDVAAGIVGLALGTVIENAFSDNDGYAKFYQQELRSYGIDADWKQAFKLRDELFDSEMKIVGLERGGAHPRAIENSKKEKDGIVKELLGLAREAGGKINSKLVTGAGKKLAEDVQKAPKIPAVRLKNPGEGTVDSPKPNYDDPNVSAAELRAEMRKMLKENPYGQAMRGDLSGFAP